MHLLRNYTKHELEELKEENLKKVPILYKFTFFNIDDEHHTILYPMNMYYDIERNKEDIFIEFAHDKNDPKLYFLIHIDDSLSNIFHIENLTLEENLNLTNGKIYEFISSSYIGNVIENINMQNIIDNYYERKEN